MFFDILISLIVLPQLFKNDFFFEDFLVLDNSSIELQQVTGPQRVYTDVLDVKITAQSALAIDAVTGKILYKKNDQEVRSIASITKLMTALVFLDYNPGWQKEIFTIPSDRKNGGIIHLNTGEILSLKNLFYTVLIASDNDAASALARATGLSSENFVQKMNQKAKDFGLLDTTFADPTGLNINNKSTAEDILKLINLALQKSVIRETTSLSTYQFEVSSAELKRIVTLKNTNALANSYLNVIGGKTGHLEEAGYCLAVKIKGDNQHEIFVVVLGSESNFMRFQDIKAVTDYVFTNYEW